MAKYTEAQARAAQKYKDENVERFTLSFKKGEKDEWKQYAKEKHGLSLNALIIKLLEEDKNK